MDNKKYFITYCDYIETHKARIIYETKTKPRFLKYCLIHGFEFIEINTNVASPYNLGFAKVFWIKQNIENGKLKDGDIVTYMDIDCCILNFDIPPIFDADFSIVNESTGCLCMGGTWSIRISDWSKRFINEMCSPILQEVNKNLQSWNIWHENDAIYHILGVNWGQSMTEIGTRDTTPFTKDELNSHVKILGCEWGTTFSKDDTDLENSPYYYKIIAKYAKPEKELPIDKIIVRHLSGGQLYEKWAERYYNYIS